MLHWNGSDKCHLFWSISTAVHLFWFYITMQTFKYLYNTVLYLLKFYVIIFPEFVTNMLTFHPNSLYLALYILFCAWSWKAFLLNSAKMCRSFFSLRLVWVWETATAANIGCDPFSERVSARCKGEKASKQESIEDCVSRGSLFGKLVSAYVY